LPIYEPGLEEMVKRNVEDGRRLSLRKLAKGIRRSDVVFLCGGTPPKANGETDLSFVEAAAQEVAAISNRYKIIVNNPQCQSGRAISSAPQSSATAAARSNSMSCPTPNS
jgi:UDP-glucose 6-dehydrogenase